MVEEIVKQLKIKPRFKERIEHVEVLKARKAEFGKIKKELPKNIDNYLKKKNIKLYKHQSIAIDILRAGENLIITTPTASGKTLAFDVPIFEKLYLDKYATALFLYPTKALSNDQLKVIKEIERLTEIKVNPDVYDGDTPTHRRPRIRENSRIVISNPYELHQILPWHYKWQKFLNNLKFIVIDEAHRYRGVFGSNVAFLMKRMKRICDYYNSKPQYILSTATLANPIEFGERLTGVKFKLVSEDGSPKGKKYFIFYNPFFNGVGELSTTTETKDLFLFYLKNDLQTLCFTVSRKTAELISSWARKDAKKVESILVDKISSYRAGYLPEERRKIENDLKNKNLLGVISTNALELGIDIGSLDSVIISGYPGTVISTWQQAGRAGRGEEESIATLIAFQNPLDQYFMKNPELFFDKPHEHAIIDSSNPYIISGHLLCAASELPLKIKEDKRYFGNNLGKFLSSLKQESLLKETLNGYVYSGKIRATEAVSIDNISSDVFKVVCDGKLLETMDRPQAYREAHKGAILLHQGETYYVRELNLEDHIIDVKKEEVDYNTEALKVVDIKIIKELKNKKIGKFSISFGDVGVNEEYIRYKIKKYSEVIGSVPLNLPPLYFKTTGMWFTVPTEICDKIWNVRKKDKDIIKRIEETGGEDFKIEVFAGGLHGVEHSTIAIMPFIVMCDRWDIGGVSTNYHPQTAKPTVFIYDGFEGGIGLTEKAYDLIENLLKMTYNLVNKCECESGCPACIYSPKCGDENEPLDKKGTILILNELIKMINESNKN